jgi:hypothetical protein
MTLLKLMGMQIEMAMIRTTMACNPLHMACTWVKTRRETVHVKTRMKIIQAGS